MTDEKTTTHNGELLVSRRTFLYGAAAAGTAAALSLGVTGCGTIVGGGGDDVVYLEVPESSLVTLNDMTALDNPDSKVMLTGQFDAPYGTLLWANDDYVAACLLPTETGSPLAKVGLLFLGSGYIPVLLERAVGAIDHYEIYDVRATAEGLIWTEANVMRGTWRIYTARLAGDTIEGGPVLAEEGDATYDTPMIAIAGGYAFWQVVPKQPNDANLTSRLMRVAFGTDNATCVFENARRMITPPYSGGDTITIVPRLDTAAYHQLTAINAKSGDVIDTLTLPSGMTPLEAGYGQNGFMFSFSAIYDYGGGISNLGTYTPTTKPSDGNYSNVKWFGFARTPTAAPAWCNGLLIVKSTYSVCGVDLNDGTYFAIDVDNGTDDYGDYLATSGTHNIFVTYSNIDHKPVNDKAIHTCRVKIWSRVG